MGPRKQPCQLLAQKRRAGMCGYLQVGRQLATFAESIELEADDDGMSLPDLKACLAGWSKSAAGSLDSRRKFRDWQMENLTPEEFALVNDGEIGRKALWRIYLLDRFGEAARTFDAW